MPAALFAARDLDSDNDLVPLAAVFSALGHKHRLSILRELLRSDEPMSVPELRVLVAGPATVLEHLKTLKAAGFVEIVGQSRASKWQVVPGSLDRAAGLIASDGHPKPETAVLKRCQQPSGAGFKIAAHWTFLPWTSTESCFAAGRCRQRCIACVRD